jgi:hypothetical protein
MALMSVRIDIFKKASQTSLKVTLSQPVVGYFTSEIFKEQQKIKR